MHVDSITSRRESNPQPLAPQASALGPPKSQLTNASDGGCSTADDSASRGRAAPGAARSAREGSDDADLGIIIDAWPTLPATVKAGIVAMVKAASGE